MPRTNAKRAIDSCSRRLPGRFLPYFLLATLSFAISLPIFAGDKEKDEETLKNAAAVLEEMTKSDAISPSTLAKADCVLIMPAVKKGGFIIGGGGGRGAMSCRAGEKFDGAWSAPAMYSTGGASIGLQAGGSSSDYVLLMMSDKGVEAILKDKTKMGTDATAAAGPSGATKESSSVGGADILTYGRAKGLFAGVSLEGATLHQDTDANKRLYDKAVGAQEIVRKTDVKPTAAGKSLMDLLSTKIPKHEQ